MANFTPIVNLEKPLGSEHYLIPKFNANMDKIDAKFGEVAPKDSPELTGVPTAPTALVGTNTNQIATTAFVKAVIAALVDSSPSTLDTLNELAAALGDDPNFATTMATELGLRAPKESPALTGTPTAPTAPLGANTLQIANSAFVKAQIANDSVPPNNPIFTGLITSGGQIKFPATQVPSSDPNTLDDYEEGTWTPAVIGTTVAGNQTYSQRAGVYVKIGRMVHIAFRITLSAKDPAISGNLRIAGLPFAQSAFSMLNFGVLFGLTMASGYPVQYGSNGSSSGFDLMSLSDGSWNNIPVANMTGGFDIIASATYQVS